MPRGVSRRSKRRLEPEQDRRESAGDLCRARDALFKVRSALDKELKQKSPGNEEQVVKLLKHLKAARDIYLGLVESSQNAGSATAPRADSRYSLADLGADS